jgi:hypothetical protein
VSQRGVAFTREDQRLDLCRTVARPLGRVGGARPALDGAIEGAALERRATRCDVLLWVRRLRDGGGGGDEQREQQRGANDTSKPPVLVTPMGPLSRRPTDCDRKRPPTGSNVLIPAGGL